MNLWSIVRVIVRRPHYRTPRIQQGFPLRELPRDFEEFVWDIVMPRVGLFCLAANLALQTVTIVVSGLVIGELGYVIPAETLRVILRLTALSRVGMTEGTRFAHAALATMVILPVV